MKLATDHRGELRRQFAPKAVAEALGVHKVTILRMIERKEITAVSLRPGVLRIPEFELERLLQSRNIGREL